MSAPDEMTLEAAAKSRRYPSYLAKVGVRGTERTVVVILGPEATAVFVPGERDLRYFAHLTLRLEHGLSESELEWLGG